MNKIIGIFIYLLHFEAMVNCLMTHKKDILLKEGTERDNHDNHTRYKLDYNSFIHKRDRPLRAKRAVMFGDSIGIESIEIKFNWDDFLSGPRLGSGFLLKKGQNFVENALLYAPKDGGFTVRGLMDASGYLGEVKIIRDRYGLDNINSTNPEDVLSFKVDTPRIVSGDEAIAVLEALTRVSKSAMRLETVSVSLRLQERSSNNLYLQVLSVSSNSTSPRALVHIIPYTSTVIVNDLPAQSVMKLTLKAFNVSRTPIEIYSVLLFTGSVTSLQRSKVPVMVASRIIPKNQNVVRETVTCYVENKAPFQGLPCKGTEVCIPLHWECDGEVDCSDGYDESNCKTGLSSYNTRNSYNQNTNKCRRNEFQCVSRDVPVCLPISWMCDGRTDCSNGWDEDKTNCGYSQYPDYSSNHYSGSKCKRNYFRCGRGGCISPRRICDGYRDCADGSDETNCSDEDEDDEDVDDDDDDDYICDSDFEFTCFRSRGSRKCVPRPWICDDQNDCPSGEDEYHDVCHNSNSNNSYD